MLRRRRPRRRWRPFARGLRAGRTTTRGPRSRLERSSAVARATSAATFWASRGRINGEVRHSTLQPCPRSRNLSAKNYKAVSNLVTRRTICALHARRGEGAAFTTRRSQRRRNSSLPARTRAGTNSASGRMSAFSSRARQLRCRSVGLSPWFPPKTGPVDRQRALGVRRSEI